jgi:hypothetical protein
MLLRIYALASLLVFVMAVGAAFAAGGIYIDNLKITNNGKEVFSDAFNSGKLIGWNKMNDAIWSSDRANTQQGAMLLNKHQFCAATAYHSFSAKNIGIVEVSADVYCTPPDEQYERISKKNACGTFFRLYSGSSNATIEAKIQLNVCQSTYQLGITHLDARQGETYSKLPVMQPATWSHIVLRLDPRSATATMFLGGKAYVTAGYDPQQFQSLQEIGIVTGLGDGSKRTD